MQDTVVSLLDHAGRVSGHYSVRVQMAEDAAKRNLHIAKNTVSHLYLGPEGIQAIGPAFPSYWVGEHPLTAPLHREGVRPSDGTPPIVVGGVPLPHLPLPDEVAARCNLESVVTTSGRLVGKRPLDDVDEQAPSRQYHRCEERGSRGEPLTAHNVSAAIKVDWLPEGWEAVYSHDYQKWYYVFTDVSSGTQLTTWDAPAAKT
jgi:hypothetical protein